MLIIPAKVSKVETEAFRNITGITKVEIRSDNLAKPDGASTSFPLGNDLFRNVTTITEIKLPQTVKPPMVACRYVRFAALMRSFSS